MTTLGNHPSRNLRRRCRTPLGCLEILGMVKREERGAYL